ncbi:uncharacterized protein LOC142985638 [Anticarsia gemmatalis]|uniref:uncharacterized protein LOC142985638 n=1 Tax=Anticarsia gemmatalis TaxID=129554 RepID=UPI003F75DAA3
MEKLQMCRICLAADVRQQIILNTHLQEIFEKLTDVPLETEDNKPTVVCFICCSRLQSCYELRQNCLRSEMLFTQLLGGHELKPLQVYSLASKLVISPVVNWDITADVEETEVVKKEEIKSLPVKIEHNQAIAHESTEQNSIEFDNNDNTQSSDPEDDIPLKLIKTEPRVKKKRVRVRKKEKDDVKPLIIDAHEIILTREEQESNLRARCKSLNYTLSPFKCELCYKGFVDENAYMNHKLKHDERSGCYACEICHMRYRSKQHLRTHVSSAHSRLFRCNKCGHTTHTANQARVHEKWHNGYTYECQLCSHKFKKPTSYLSHMRKRHPTEHVCNICGESFVGKHGLMMHKSKTHNNGELIKESADEPASDRYCNDCDIQFYTKDAWKRHILYSVKHTLKNESSTECSICGWRGRGDTLAVHLKEHCRSLKLKRPVTHVADKLHCHCPQCGQKYKSRSKLQAHINRIHLGLKYNKNIVCEVCGIHCTSNARLKYHQRTHTGERPYSCNTCGKHFSDSNQLRIHTRTHTGEKPYVCAVCGKRFTQKPALNRHYRVHTGDKPYSCQFCSRTFSQSNSVKLHVRTVHLKLPANNRKKTQQKIEIEIQIEDGN